MILVTGATGRVGYPLLEALADTGAEVTAMVRVPAKGADLPGAAKYIVASFDDPPPAEVLQTFDRIFLLSPAIAGAGRAGDPVHRRGAGRGPPAAHRQDGHGRIPGPGGRGALRAQPPGDRRAPGSVRAAGQLPRAGHLPGDAAGRGGAGQPGRHALHARRVRPGRLRGGQRRGRRGRAGADHPGARGPHVRADRAGGAHRPAAGPADLHRVRPGGGLRRPASRAGQGRNCWPAGWASGRWTARWSCPTGCARAGRPR